MLSMFTYKEVYMMHPLVHTSFIDYEETDDDGDCQTDYDDEADADSFLITCLDELNINVGLQQLSPFKKSSPDYVVAVCLSAELAGVFLVACRNSSV